MINRSPQHQTDTKSIRNIIMQLDENWLIRNLDERDYGIDLTLERFDGMNATGDFILVQAKGTDAGFDEEIKLSNFPTKTIWYSQLFNIPFFVFYTSNKSGQTYFVWLQKYANTKLIRTTPDWKSQAGVTIYFPDENNLKDNKQKIIDIIRKDKDKKIGLDFLATFESIKLHSQSVLSGETGVNIVMKPARPCLPSIISLHLSQKTSRTATRSTSLILVTHIEKYLKQTQYQLKTAI